MAEAAIVDRGRGLIDKVFLVDSGRSTFAPFTAQPEPRTVL
jgi:hypothetical protein